MMSNALVIIGVLLAFFVGPLAWIVLAAMRSRSLPDEPTEIGLDYLPADPVHRRDVQGW